MNLGPGAGKGRSARPQDCKRSQEAEARRMAGTDIMSLGLMPAEAGSRELDAPEREAAFFYGLFLRGYSYHQLRRDIEVPPEVLAQWLRNSERDPAFASVAGSMLSYRRRVLAIFKALVAHEINRVH